MAPRFEERHRDREDCQENPEQTLGLAVIVEMLDSVAVSSIRTIGGA